MGCGVSGNQTYGLVGGIIPSCLLCLIFGTPALQFHMARALDSWQSELERLAALFNGLVKEPNSAMGKPVSERNCWILKNKIPVHLGQGAVSPA